MAPKKWPVINWASIMTWCFLTRGHLLNIHAITQELTPMLSLIQIRASLEDGLLSFPITDFDERGEFNGSGYAGRLEWFVSHNVSSVFVAGGTGEFRHVTRRRLD